MKMRKWLVHSSEEQCEEINFPFSSSNTFNPLSCALTPISASFHTTHLISRLLAPPHTFFNSKWIFFFRSFSCFSPPSSSLLPMRGWLQSRARQQFLALRDPSLHIFSFRAKIAVSHTNWCLIITSNSGKIKIIFLRSALQRRAPPV